MDELSRIPTKAPAWLANWIGRTDERLNNTEMTLTSVNSKLDTVLARLPLPGNPGPKGNSVTHKWLSEKFWVPLVFAGLTILGGLILAHILGT